MHIKKTFRLPLDLFGKYQTSNDKMGKEGEGRMGWNAPPHFLGQVYTAVIDISDVAACTRVLYTNHSLIQLFFVVSSLLYLSYILNNFTICLVSDNYLFTITSPK